MRKLALIIALILLTGCGAQSFDAVSELRTGGEMSAEIEDNTVNKPDEVVEASDDFPFELGDEYLPGDSPELSQVEMTLLNVTPTCADAVIHNGMDCEITDRIGYTLCAVRGETYYKVKGREFEDDGIEPASAKPGDFLELSLDFDKIYPELPAGEYVIFKNISADSQPFTVKGYFLIGSGIDTGMLDEPPVIADVPDDRVSDEKPEEKTETASPGADHSDEVDPGYLEDVPVHPRASVYLLDEVICETEGIKIECVSATPSGMWLDLTNEQYDDAVVFLSDGYELNLLCGDDRYGMISVYTDAEVSRYAVEKGETASLEIDWSVRHGFLPDGKYVIYIHTNKGAAAAEFSIGSGVTDTGSLNIIETSRKDDFDLGLDSIVLPDKGSIGEAAENQELLNETDGVSLTVADAHSYGIDVTFKNESSEDLCYSAAYSLHRKIGGTWYRVNMDPHAAFPMSALWLMPGEQERSFLNLSDVYGELPNGEYRFVKSYNPGDGENGVVLGCQFSVRDYGEPSKAGDIWCSDRAGDTVPGLSASVADVTPDGVAVTVKNERGSDVMREAKYYLKVKKDGQWYRLKTLNPENTADTSEMCTISPGDSEEIILDWKDLYGSLTEGEYAVAIRFYSDDQPFAENAPIYAGGMQRAVIDAVFTVDG